ncbi:MAG: hypothetical protein JW709_03515 [Sedimentisphaerales bacterium]|nr:hypothetical protein [Sedimentisphaerales bacterium]
MKNLNVWLVTAIIVLIAVCLWTVRIVQNHTLSQVRLYGLVFDARCADTGEHLNVGVSSPATSPQKIDLPCKIEMPYGEPIRITCVGTDMPSFMISHEGYQDVRLELEILNGILGGTLPVRVIEMEKANPSGNKKK